EDDHPRLDRCQRNGRRDRHPGRGIDRIDLRRPAPARDGRRMTALPSSGRVAEVPFARVVGGLATRNLTGVLRLEQEGRRYATYWLDGAIADADSDNPEDPLGRIALEAGLVESGVISESLRRMAQSRTKTQRDILIEMGALKGDVLERALRLALTRRALRTFALPTASFT